MKALRAVLVAVVAAAAALTTVAAPASAAPTGYYSVPYSDELIYHYHSAYGQYTYPASYDSWARDGFPTPSRAPVDYVRYPWSTSIHAVSFFDGDSSTWHWEHLSFDQWRRAGSPQARAAGWIDGSSVYRWASSDELFLRSPDGVRHKLTYPEWAATGLRPPTTNWSAGYYKYPWSSSIGYLYNTPTGAGYPIGYNEWAEAGFPTPQTVTHVVNQEVWKSRWSSQLYLDSGIVGGFYPIGWNEWTALGRPTPVVW